MYLLIINILCLTDTIIKYNICSHNINLCTTSLISISSRKIHNCGFAFSLWTNGHGNYKKILHVFVLFILILLQIIYINVYLEALIIASLYNLLDRLLCGYIVDYIEIKIFDCSLIPIFNICDIVIIINICLLIING